MDDIAKIYEEANLKISATYGKNIPYNSGSIIVKLNVPSALVVSRGLPYSDISMPFMPLPNLFSTRPLISNSIVGVPYMSIKVVHE